MSNQLRLLTMTVVVCLSCCAPVFAQTTAFTYQGRLTDGGTPANGNYDLQFTLWNSLTGGTMVQSQTLNNVAVSNGVFTVSLDFGTSSFTGPNRFLEIGAKPAGSGSFTTLTPRQQITSTPYAVRSLNAASADSVPASGVSAGSGNYIQNTSTQQSSSNFNITGNGTAGGTLTGNVVNAATQFNLGGNRMLGAGSDNLFLGFESGFLNTGGIENSFFGRSAGRENTTGIGNSFFGLRAGSTITTGSFNSFFGHRAGGGILTGQGGGTFNSFFGHATGLRNSGGDNSFFGAGAGVINELGSGNTFVGHLAGESNRIGSFNTVVGDNADVFQSDLTNATAIGANAQVSQSNSLVLGSISGTNGATADTKVGIGTTAPGFKLEVVDPSNTGLRVQTNATGGTVASFGGNGAFEIDSPGVSGGRFRIAENGNVTIGVAEVGGNLTAFGSTLLNTVTVANGAKINVLGTAGSTQLCRNANAEISSCSSSLRYKTNVAPFLSSVSFIKQLRPISFAWKQGGMKDVGFGAEDVAKLNPLFVTYNANGEVEGVKYDRLSVAFVNAFKEQQTQIERQQSEIEQQATLIKQLQIQIDLMKKMVCLERPNADVCKEGLKFDE